MGLVCLEQGRQPPPPRINGRKEWTRQAHLGKKAESHQHEGGEGPRPGGALRRGRPQAREGAWSSASSPSSPWGALELGTPRPTAQH